MTEKLLPKVLIIGQTFTTDTGGGITLSGLFKNWPREKLAIAVESKETLDFTKCANYYRIGYQELQMPFPLSSLQRKTNSGMVTETSAVGAKTIKPTHPKKEKIKNLFDNALNYSGLYFWAYGNQILSEDFVSWVKNFGPDVIYYQPNSYKSIDFVLALKERVDVPLVSHVMDDWFSFCIKPNPLFYYWQKQLDKKVKSLFAATQLHLSICDYMSDEYSKRYGYKFYPFHNAVDLEFWGQYAKKNVEAANPFKILYAGRIGYGIDKTLLAIVNIIEKMNEKTRKIVLEIQTKDQNHPLIDKLRIYKSVKLSKSIPYEILPKKFAEADALLIPYDFDGSGLKYIKFSMPTKVSEYMSTGTPVLVVGPSETGLLQYAKQGWAKVCEVNKPTHIESAIEELISSKTLRSQIVTMAKELVSKNHDENNNINQFRNHIQNLVKSGHHEELST